MTTKIKEAWTGPGRRDGVITEFKPENDGLHIDMKRREFFYILSCALNI